MSSANITSVTSVTTPPTQNSNITLHGTGFGASQGTSIVYVFPETGQFDVPAIVSWTTTAITLTLPATMDITSNAFAIVQIGGEQSGARSPNFTVAAEIFPAETNFSNGRFIGAPPGTLDVGSNPLPLVNPPYFECVGVITGFPGPDYNSDWQTDTQGNTNSATVSPGSFLLLGDLTVRHANALGLLFPGQGGGG